MFRWLGEFLTPSNHGHRWLSYPATIQPFLNSHCWCWDTTNCLVFWHVRGKNPTFSWPFWNVQTSNFGSNLVNKSNSELLVLASPIHWSSKKATSFVHIQKRASYHLQQRCSFGFCSAGDGKETASWGYKKTTKTQTKMMFLCVLVRFNMFNLILGILKQQRIRFKL